MKSIHVGIDISKATLDFCVMGPEKVTYHNIKNKVTAIRKLLKTIADLDPGALICMENQRTQGSFSDRSSTKALRF